MSTERKIAFFVGDDVTSHIILNSVIPEAVNNGVTPVLYMVSTPDSLKRDIPELQELALYERGLIREVIYPFLHNEYNGVAGNLSPWQLATQYDLDLHEIDDVNAPLLIDSIRKDPEIEHGISLRCLRIFHDDMINMWDEKGGKFINAHPGLLPGFRGLMSVAYAMNDDNEKHCGWTTHHITRTVDRGRILSKQSRPLDPEKSSFENTLDMVEQGIILLTRTVEDLRRNDPMDGYPQVKSDGKYFSLPNERTVARMAKNGVKFVNKEPLILRLAQLFAHSAEAPQGLELQRRIREAVTKREKTPNSSPTGGTPPVTVLGIGKGIPHFGQRPHVAASSPVLRTPPNVLSTKSTPVALRIR